MKPHFVIFAEKHPQIGEVRGSAYGLSPTPAVTGQANPPTTGELKDWAKALSSALSDRGYDGAGVALAIPAHWCICATIAVADLPRRNRRQLMIYRLEEQLPLAAEEMVVDFALTTASDIDEVMGVGVAIARLSPWLDALEAEGILVQSVSPSVLLSFQARTGGQESPVAADALLYRNDSAIEVLRLRGGSVVGWSTEPDLERAQAQLRYMKLQQRGPLLVMAWGLDSEATAALMSTGDMRLIIDKGAAVNTSEGGQSQDSLKIAATRGAVSVLAGERPLIELRRDLLAPPQPLRQIRTPLASAIVATILFGFCLAVSLLLRAQGYNRQIQRSEDAQRAVYQETLGKPPMGANITARLDSEDRRLLALSGMLELSDKTRDNGSTLPRSASVLLFLNDTLRSLPKNLRYRLLELRFSGDGLQLDGESRSHGDADAIADGLRSVGGYAVDPPHSETRGQDKGVSFTITAKAIQVSELVRRTP